MTTERTLTLEEAVPLLQQQSSDRLVLFRLHQSCNQDIVNYINQRTNQLERDVAEVSAATRARNQASQASSPSVITTPEPETDEKTESDDEDLDSE